QAASQRGQRIGKRSAPPDGELVIGQLQVVAHAGDPDVVPAGTGPTSDLGRVPAEQLAPEPDPGAPRDPWQQQILDRHHFLFLGHAGYVGVDDNRAFRALVRTEAEPPVTRPDLHPAADILARRRKPRQQSATLTRSSDIAPQYRPALP